MAGSLGQLTDQKPGGLPPGSSEDTLRLWLEAVKPVDRGLSRERPSSLLVTASFLVFDLAFFGSSLVSCARWRAQERSSTSSLLRSRWGRSRVSAPEDLVLLKRTNRPGDYEAILNLVRLRVVEDKGGSVRTPVGPPEHVRRGGPRGLWPPSGGQAESVALRPPPCVPCSPSPRLPCQS